MTKQEQEQKQKPPVPEPQTTTTEKIKEKISSFDIFGQGANFTFSGSSIFKTKTGVCCTIYALLAFISFIYAYFSRPFIPFDTDIVYNTVKKRDELIEEKLNFESYLLFWFYINKDVKEADSVPYDFIEYADFHKYIYTSRCVFRRWDLDEKTKKKIFNKYNCKFEPISDEIGKLLEKAMTKKPQKGDFGFEKPYYLAVKEKVGEEDPLEASDYASVTVLPCTKLDHKDCEEDRVSKYRIFIMHKPMNVNHDKRIVMGYYTDMVKRGIDIYEGNPLNFTVKDEFEPIKLAQKGELSETYIFLDNEINYFEFFPLRKHTQNMLSFLNGSIIEKFGAFENYYGGHGATMIYRWGIDKGQVWLLTKFRVKSGEIAGMISMIGLIVVIIYGSYNTKRLDNNIMNSLGKDQNGGKIAEFKNQNIITFYLKNPGYSFKFYFDYSNPNTAKNRLATVKDKMRRLLYEHEREEEFIKAAIEVLYNEELELTKIFYDGCRLQGFKESFLNEDTEILLRIAYIGRGYRIIRSVEKNPIFDEKKVSLYGFSGKGEKKEGGRKVIEDLMVSGVDFGGEEERNRDQISIGSGDGDSGDDEKL